MIHATVDGSYRKERGDRKVRVGIIDTGVDGPPRYRPELQRSLSRNFTVDIPFDPLSGEEIDGPCTEEPDASCNDANDVDENSHGTHVASTVGSPINGIGMAGVAPEVTLVNLRGGQDSGFFFLQPSVDALTYAGDHGIDVVNMSYFIDPWLYNCRGLAEDTPAGPTRSRSPRPPSALDYAHMHGVTLVGAAGNGLTDLTMPKPVVDTQSPNFPLHKNHNRTVNNGCLDLPTEGNNVISVSSVGPSKIKADYSNYGYGEIGVAAPGGWFRDDPRSLSQTPDERTAAGIPNQILAAYPENVARVRRHRRERKPDERLRRQELQGLDVRLLPVDPGHVDGGSARDGRSGADRLEVRRPAWRRGHDAPALHPGLPRGLGERHPVHDAEPVHLHPQGAPGRLHDVV